MALYLTPSFFFFFYCSLHQAPKHVSCELKDDVAVTQLNDTTAKVCGCINVVVCLWRKSVRQYIYVREREIMFVTVLTACLCLSLSLTDVT